MKAAGDVPTALIVSTPPISPGKAGRKLWGII
jgi:hypothetical protein